MKTSTLLLICILISGAFCAQLNPGCSVLELKGRIQNSCPRQQSCSITLYCQNQVVDSVRSNQGQFTFILQKDKYYTLKMSMADCFDKLLCIDTRNGQLRADGAIHHFSFETMLFTRKNCPVAETDLLDFPIAILYYDPTCRRFSYDRSYTRQARKEMQLAASAK